ncbi:hypothetical protein Bca52824_002416 [Brassica carinata]|uniref:DUF1985 domain-containing protein n=1 Tax=Brassica carinata TaxID=52824 RepID=A0A8X7WKM7_BRACI|nr:hypothetical protein Bca52824_002416 [Brassica carinata]
MLKRRKVKDRETRLKIACLAITSSVLLPSSHTPRLIPEQVELSRNFDDFMAYPWGHLVSLAQSSVALRGYVDALQLVLIAAVPTLIEEDAASKDKPQAGAKFEVIPGNARKMDRDCTMSILVPVKSILDEPEVDWSQGFDFSWEDETADPLVDEMVRFYFERFEFKKEMFVGGLTSVELARLRLEKKNKDKETKDKDEKEQLHEFAEFESSDVPQSSGLANQLGTVMKGFVGDIEGRLKATVQLAVQHAMQDALKSLDVSLGDGLEKMHCALTKTVKDLLSKVSSSSFYEGQGNDPPNVDDQSGGPGVIPPPVVPPKSQAMGSTVARDVIDAVLDEINGKSPTQQSTFVGDSGRCSSLRLKKTINLGGQTFVDREPIPVKLVAPTLPDVVVEEKNPKAHVESVSGDTISHNIGDKFPPNTQTSQEKIIDSPPSNIEPLQPNHTDVFPGAVPAVNLGVPDVVEEQTEQQPDVTNTASPPASVEEPNPIRDSLDSEMHIPYNLLEIPSFSLGLSQEQVPDVLVDVNPLNVVMPEEQDDGVDVERRKSKRARNKPAVLNDFQCDPKIGLGHKINPDVGELFSELQNELSQKMVIDISPSLSISPIDFSDIALRPQHIGPKVVDALMHYLGRQLSSDDSNVQIFDTTLPASLIKQHSRLVKTAVKDHSKLKFSASAISILDCNVAFKSESLLKKDLNPVANIMPYIKPFSLIRAKGVPQIANPGDAAVMAVLLIEAHANGGMQALKCITTRILPYAAKQLAVNFYKDLSL